MICANKITNAPPIGSTIPDSVPITKALFLDTPSALNGIEIMAPSGKFWIAIPNAKAKAAETLMTEWAAAVAAKTTPTAIPSGKL